MKNKESKQHFLSRLAQIAPIVRGLLAEETGNQDIPYKPVILKSLTSKEALEIIEGNVFLQILNRFDWVRVNQIVRRNKTDVHATVAVLAILRYSKDKGSFPEDLEQLISAGYLKQPPDDVFSVKPLVYRKTDDDFILYSVGPNLTDEGGEYSRDSKGRIKNWQNNGDTVFWPVASSEALK
jgi:hypothetical protein